MMDHPGYHYNNTQDSSAAELAEVILDHLLPNPLSWDCLGTGNVEQELDKYIRAKTKDLYDARDVLNFVVNDTIGGRSNPVRAAAWQLCEETCAQLRAARRAAIFVRDWWREERDHTPNQTREETDERTCERIERELAENGNLADDTRKFIGFIAFTLLSYAHDALTGHFARLPLSVEMES